MMQFLSKTTDKAQLSNLIAQLVCALDVSDPDASNAALHALCAEEIYKSRLGAAPQDFVTGTDTWPEIRTSARRYGAQLKERTLLIRNNNIKAVHAALKSTRPLFENGGYSHWLNQGNIDRVVAATKTAFPAATATYDLAMQSICQLCEATSQPELKKHIYQAYTAATAGRVATAPRQKPTMTAEQLQAVRAGIERLRQKAMDSGFRIAHCNDYLQLGFLYGCSDAHVPQRSDYVTFRYDGPDCDQARDNYIAITDTECVLTINKATKVKLSAPNIIALHETSPKLAEFLVRFREHAQTAQQSNAPYLLMTTQLPIRPMTASNLTTRAPRLWQKLGLDFDAHGCIAARKAAVAASNRALGKRKLTAVEIESETVRAKQMMHSRAAAEKHYG